MKDASVLAILMATLCSTGCGDPGYLFPKDAEITAEELQEWFPYDSIQLWVHSYPTTPVSPYEYSMTLRRDGTGTYWGGRCARVKGGLEVHDLWWGYAQVLYFIDEHNVIAQMDEYRLNLSSHPSPYRFLIWERGRADPLEYTVEPGEESVDMWVLRRMFAGLILSPFWERVSLLPSDAEESITSVVNAFWLAAATGDSVALDSLVATPQPLEWVRDGHGDYPHFFEMTAGNLDVGPLYPGTAASDSVLALIRVPWVWSPPDHLFPGQEMDIINVRVTPLSGRWCIVAVGRYSC